MKRLVPIIVVGVLAAAAATAEGAATRAEYVAQVDPICKAGQADMRAKARKNRAAVREIGKALEREAGMISREREVALLGALARLSFEPTLKVFPRVSAQIAAVAPEPADAAAVSKWLAARAAYLKLIKASVAAAERGASKKQNFLIEKATSKIVEGEIPVEGFGFRYCLLSNSQD